MNAWLELSFDAQDAAESARLTQILEAAGACAVSYQAADDEELYEPPVGEIPLWQHTRVLGLFTDDCDLAALAQFLKDHQAQACAVRTLENSDWSRVWLEYFKPMNFGRHFWVAAQEHRIEDPEATVLRLDPGLAFGTGTHPSTAMCLRYLVAHAPWTGQVVYDYGCGSGILGIAAALLGAQAVYQTDIDPQACTAARENAAKNKVAPVICAQPSDAPQVDFIIANILLQPLCALRPQFEQHLKATGCMVFSGLLERQEANIREAYGDGYVIERLEQCEGWILLRLTPR